MLLLEYYLFGFLFSLSKAETLSDVDSIMDLSVVFSKKYVLNSMFFSRFAGTVGVKGSAALVLLLYKS